jgi:CheY-like chemotaxis protein
MDFTMRRHPYILIADDDADDRFLMDSAFKEIEGLAKLSFVENGSQVLDYLNAINDGDALPDLIVLDLNMPLMNGPETLLLLKEHERYKRIPVIIHSTSESETDRARCLGIGAASYLYKGSGYDKVVEVAQFLHDVSRRNDIYF